MKILAFFVLAFCFCITVKAQNTVWCSPLTFSTANPNISIIPWQPSTSIKINTTVVGDLQWIELGLNIPSNQKIDSVLVYYQLSNSLSYISQIRLTRMTTPDAAYVIHDDGTDLTSTTPTYYSSYVGGMPINGTITLGLRLNFSDTQDFIRIGAIAIVISPVTTSVEALESNKITDYKLVQNYPNPFNPSTTIQYNVPTTQNVKILIYNTNGQLIRELLDDEKDAGSYSIIWDGKDNAGNLVASGTYFYQIQASDFVEAKKMIFLK